MAGMIEKTSTCGTCKHFGKLIGDGVLTRYPEDSDEVIQNAKFHECTLLKHLNKGPDATHEGVAGVIDGSGYHATFCVSEEFGCNQWAGKE